ncbi:DctP family TRAP transporter solute-binding subunit [Peribacillus glennii]|uniref:DctP family TRAP transporter solute-binding subunit n=1 Tax=Peribacillus glennii TaxID=2303991 RepID=A0A372LIW9_9BACI|nr:DctP family TRAP transporter solute-binding subunit [Peribacillus glennii]RFU66300.1 DctP family TRAP transporter solute-binding subunit [Peribacillus glennii]
MRSFWAPLLLIVVGLGIASVIAFQSFSPGKKLSIDDEQQGLNDQVIIKFSHVVAENTPKGLAAKRFAGLVEKYTEHKVRVEVYPNQSLYSDGEEIEALQRNEVQMIAPAASKITELSPKWLLLDLPYIFPNHEALKYALTGEIGTELLSSLEEEDIKGLSFWSNHFKQITSNSPIRHPSDFKGKNFRIMKSRVLEEQFSHFGATTSATAFNDTFKNLEKNEMDSQENTITNINSKKLYQVQKYMTISDHGYLGYAVLVNKRFWDSLPGDIKEDIEKAMAETTDWLWEKSQEMNTQQMEEIKSNSRIQIYTLTNAEKRAWMREMTVIYGQFEPSIGKELMEKAQVIRQKYTP